jgi:hypothetical protein
LFDARLMRRAPKSLKLSILSRWALGAGVVGLACSTVPSSAAALLGVSPGPVLAGLSLWSVSALLFSELLRWALHVQPPPRALPEAELALAAREFSPLVDLSAPLQIESVFLEPTPLHDLMQGLSTWRADQWHTAADCAATLQHQLWASALPGAQLDLQRRLGQDGAAPVAELVVDDSVLVDFQLGLRRQDVARVAERLRSYRLAWGARPIVLVVCSSESGTLPDAAALDALVAEQELGPLIVARSCQVSPAAITAGQVSAS